MTEESLQLSPDQRQVVDLANEWFQSQDKNQEPFVLTGAAGTGKSTIINTILAENDISVSQVLMVASSATAAENIKRKNPGAEARTIASFIKGQSEVLMVYDLRTGKVAATWQKLSSMRDTHIQNLDGQVLYNQINGEQTELQKVRVSDVQSVLNILSKGRYDVKRVNSFKINDNRLEEIKDSKKKYGEILIVDELGMVSQEEMDALMSTGLPIIAAGDPYQLPPINTGGKKHPEMGQNKLINDTSRHFYAELTEVHRQALDSALLDVATSARQNKNWKKTAVKRMNEGAKDIIFDTPKHTYQNSPKALASSDIILTATNPRVQSYNQNIHNYRSYQLGNYTDLHAGEKIVITANTKTKDDSNVLSQFINGQSGTITKIYLANDLDDGVFQQLVSHKLLLVDMNIQGQEFKRILINTFMLSDPRINAFKMKDVSSEGMHYYIERLPNKSNETLNSIIKYSGTSFDEVVYVSYGYAMTVHRAQGKEWDNVIFDSYMPEKMAQNSKELVYTAITRAKKKLLIL